MRWGDKGSGLIEAFIAKFADTPADRAFAIDCGPGHCDLKEFETAKLGVLRLHRRASKSDLRGQLATLVAAIAGWPPGPVGKVLRVAGGGDEDAEPGAAANGGGM